VTNPEIFDMMYVVIRGIDALIASPFWEIFPYGVRVREIS
jgi:hypothetical protein